MVLWILFWLRTFCILLNLQDRWFHEVLSSFGTSVFWRGEALLVLFLNQSIYAHEIIFSFFTLPSFQKIFVRLFTQLHRSFSHFECCFSLLADEICFQDVSFLDHTIWGRVEVIEPLALLCLSLHFRLLSTLNLCYGHFLLFVSFRTLFLAVFCFGLVVSRMYCLQKKL